LAARESRHPAQVQQLLGGEARVDEVVGDARGAEEAAVRLLGPKLGTTCEILLGRHVRRKPERGGTPAQNGKA